VLPVVRGLGAAQILPACSTSLPEAATGVATTGWVVAHWTVKAVRMQGVVAWPPHAVVVGPSSARSAAVLLTVAPTDPGAQRVASSLSAPEPERPTDVWAHRKLELVLGQSRSQAVAFVD